MKNEIVIKRIIKKGKHGQNGSSWKVAYADFMTAMMMLFFILWILSSVDEESLGGIGNYFASTVFQESGRKSDKGQVESNKGKNADKKKSMFSKELEMKLGKIGDTVKISENSDNIMITFESNENAKIFNTRSSNPLPILHTAIELVVKEIKGTSYYISIEGHTNGEEFSPNEDYSNWELSTNRANSVRRDFIKLGLDPARIVNISGSADVKPQDFSIPTALHNRRVDLKLLKGKKQVGQNKRNFPNIFGEND